MLTILFFSSFGFCEEDSIKTHTDSSAITVVQPDSSRVLKHLFDPKVAAISSLIPGGGQVYTKHYIKAGIFVAAEIGVGLLGYQRYIWQKDLRHAADSVSGLAKQYADSVQHDSAQGKAIDTLISLRQIATVTTKKLHSMSLSNVLPGQSAFTITILWMQSMPRNFSKTTINAIRCAPVCCLQFQGLVSAKFTMVNYRKPA
jgi:hypothetical protein